jgi:hypothetical protein
MLSPWRGWKTALFLFAALPLLRAAATTPATPPELVSVPHLFQYQAPPGWSVRSIATFSKYPIARNEANAAVVPQITVEMETSPEPLANWSRQFLAKNRDSLAAYRVRTGDLEPFITTAGARGFHATLDFSANVGPTTLQLHYAYYFFEGSKNAKFVVACLCARDDTDHDAPLFDAAMTTFVPD